MRKRVKSPLLCRKLLRNPSKRIKTSTPQLDREGLFLPVQAPFKKKNTCFCPPRPSHNHLSITKKLPVLLPMTRLLYISEGCEELKRVIFYIIIQYNL